MASNVRSVPYTGTAFGGFWGERECTQVVEPGDVVHVLVGEQHGIELIHLFAQQLLAHVGSAIDQQCDPFSPHQNRGTGALIARVRAGTHRATAPDHGDALTGTGAKKDQFCHAQGCEVNGPSTGRSRKTWSPDFRALAHLYAHTF
jgi:hypothetical protein